jgi:serine/threonine protein kinase
MINDEGVDESISDFVRAQADISINRYSDSGANGELYFGERNVLKDRVALKFYYYNPAYSTHEEPLLLKEVKHENILEIFDAKIIDKQYAYFLTPEISGGDLQRFLSKNIISTHTSVNIVQGILKGIAELHKEENSLVHRDLKPNNILIDKESLTPYIADFGSIKKIEDGKNEAVASKNTFIYKPYESLIDNIYRRESDLYQIGIILFQLLGGKFPNAAADWLNEKERKKLLTIDNSFDKWQFIEEIINRKIVKGKLLDNNSLPLYIDKGLKKIINKATHTDYKKRYRTCSEFLKALYDYLKTTKNWWQDNNEYFATNGDTTYKISPTKEKYGLSIKKKTWRRDKSQLGELKSIVEYVIRK